MNQSFPKLHWQDRGTRKDNEKSKLLPNNWTSFLKSGSFSRTFTRLLVYSNRSDIGVAVFFAFSWWKSRAVIKFFLLFFLFLAWPKFLWQRGRRKGVGKKALTLDICMKPTNPLYWPHRSAASPIKIMKSRIWEEGGRVVKSLSEALGARMGVNGRLPPRSYRPPHNGLSNRSKISDPSYPWYPRYPRFHRMEAKEVTWREADSPWEKNYGCKIHILSKCSYF